MYTPKKIGGWKTTLPFDSWLLFRVDVLVFGGVFGPDPPPPPNATSRFPQEIAGIKGL